jgi:thioesterase domain-containing protein
MAEAENQTEVREVVFEWLQIASGVAQGLLAPEEGVAMLQALAEAHPADRDWLQEEVGTIRHQFGLDIADLIRNGESSYWDKLRLVIKALLDERMDHELALALLRTIDAQHPEHAEQTAALINGIENSPLRRLLDMDD